MADLRPDTLLQRSPSLSLELSPFGEVVVVTNDGRTSCGPHALAILDAFANPTALSDGAEALRSHTTGPEDWMDLMSTIRQLYAAGALLNRTSGTSAPAVSELAPSSYVEMLNDRARTSAFLQGIRAVVRPGDVVVEIGTGTGILAVAAARAGAEHVYAIEASDLAEAAQAMFEANGVAERVTLLRGWSTRIEIPRRADVLISEIIGDDPLAEGVVEVTVDARKRMLKPHARMIPSRVRIYGLPLAIQESVLGTHSFGAEALENWEAWYGMNFSALGKATSVTPAAFYIRPQSLRGWHPLSDPVLLADIDLESVVAAAIDTSVIATTTVPGRLNACMVYFELELGPDVRLSTAPAQVTATNHWRLPVWPLRNPVTVSPGDRLAVSYHYRTRGSGSRLEISPA